MKFYIDLQVLSEIERAIVTVGKIIGTQTQNQDYMYVCV